MSNRESNIVITNSLIDKLIKNKKDQIIDKKEFKFLGMGGDGIVFVCGDKVVKIYTRGDMNRIIKEFYVVGLLQELDNINKNVIHIDRYYLAKSHPVMIMDLMDGDLSKWCYFMVGNKNNMTEKELENIWMSMIFQVTYGFMFLNKLKILHHDPKLRNILFAKTPHTMNNIELYEIGKQKFNVPINQYIFKIADFGAVQILGSSMNKISDKDLQRDLDQRVDLYELSRIWYIVLVQYILNDYGPAEIQVLLDNNNDFKQYYNNTKIRLNKEFHHKPHKVIERKLLHTSIYYGIENNFINENDIIAKYRLVKPSTLVLKTLDGLVNLDVKNVFDIFPMFLVE